MASIASTYARAFADVVLSARLDANRAIGGLRRIAGLLAESTELRRVWENPAVPADQKRNLLDAIVQREGIEPHVRNLIAVLIDHRRVQFLQPHYRATGEGTRRPAGIRRGTHHQCARTGRRREAVARSSDRKSNRQKNPRPVRTRRVTAGRCHRPRRQHDLRRFGEGTVGEDSRGD